MTRYSTEKIFEGVIAVIEAAAPLIVVYGPKGMPDKIEKPYVIVDEPSISYVPIVADYMADTFVTIRGYGEASDGGAGIARIMDDIQQGFTDVSIDGGQVLLEGREALPTETPETHGISIEIMISGSLR